MRKKRRDGQPDLFDAAEQRENAQGRALIDELIASTRLYDSAAAIRELFDFTARLRHVSPFNAMLLHIQKPGLSFAASAKDWDRRFHRWPRPAARPLLVLRSFGPVDFLYDIVDTEGTELPDIAWTFPTTGVVPADWLDSMRGKLRKIFVDFVGLDVGDRDAGHARLVKDSSDPNRFSQFEIGVNRNHPMATRAVTIFHELAHIYLGHCGGDAKRGVSARRPKDVALREVEAESVAYLIARRSGLKPRSESYLSRYHGAFHNLDLHLILKQTGAIERALDLPLRSGWPFAA